VFIPRCPSVVTKAAVNCCECGGSPLGAGGCVDGCVLAGCVGCASEVCRKSAQLDDDVKQLHQQLMSSNDKLQQLEMEKSSVEMDLRAVEARHVDKERQCQVVVKDFDYCKERETVLRVDRSTSLSVSISLSVCLSVCLLFVTPTVVCPVLALDTSYGRRM